MFLKFKFPLQQANDIYNTVLPYSFNTVVLISKICSRVLELSYITPHCLIVKYIILYRRSPLDIRANFIIILSNISSCARASTML